MGAGVARAGWSANSTESRWKFPVGTGRLEIGSSSNDVRGGCFLCPRTGPILCSRKGEGLLKVTSERERVCVCVCRRVHGGVYLYGVYLCGEYGYVGVCGCLSVVGGVCVCVRLSMNVVVYVDFVFLCVCVCGDCIYVCECFCMWGVCCEWVCMRRCACICMLWRLVYVCILLSTGMGVYVVFMCVCVYRGVYV